MSGVPCTMVVAGLFGEQEVRNKPIASLQGNAPGTKGTAALESRSRAVDPLCVVRITPNGYVSITS
jgi:hypothetical protein